MKKVYLDSAATTSLDPQILKIMQPYFSEKFGNPSEFHSLGQEAKKAIEEARGKLARFLNAAPDEIYFTGSATESINLSHKGLIETQKSKLKNQNLPHIITSQIEHKAVLETCAHLEKLGWARVTYLPVNKGGLVLLEEIKKSIKAETVLVSIMYVNNEVGTIQSIAEIGQFLKKINKQRTMNHKPRIFFHTDATGYPIPGL